MEAWPIEDVWLRPAVTMLLAAALPWALERGVARVLARAHAGAGRPLLIGAELLVAWLLGATALGPALVVARDGWVSHAFAGVCVLAALASGRRARSDRGAGWRPPLLALGAGVVAIQLAPLDAGSERIALGLAVAIAGVVGAWGQAPEDEERALARGAAIAAGVLALASLALPWVLTDVDLESAPHAGANASQWRLRVDPWDEAAMLGAGWASRRRDEHGRAIAQAREARRMGAPASATLELEAEVLAARGECDAARATFDRALEARAAAAFDHDSLTAPLTLGGYHLPPALVTECGGLDQLPGVGDVTGDQRP